MGKGKKRKADRGKRAYGLRVKLAPDTFGDGNITITATDGTGNTLIMRNVTHAVIENMGADSDTVFVGKNLPFEVGPT